MYPTISCRFCDEGSLSLNRPPSLVFVIILAIITFVFLIRKLLQNSRKSPIHSMMKRQNHDRRTCNSFLPYKCNSLPLNNKAPLSKMKEDCHKQQQEMSINFTNVSLTVKNSKNSRNKLRILSNVSGLIKAKEITAILGESGCGKTSLINVLAGRAFYGQVSGDIFVNGRSLNCSALRREVGFVPQVRNA